jgi:hypothetical protein
VFAHSKHPFKAGKLPVPNKFRVACIIIGSAAMTNIRSIQRFTVAKSNSGSPKEQTPAALGIFLPRLAVS